jgi:hypothetical protein
MGYCIREFMGALEGLSLDVVTHEWIFAFIFLFIERLFEAPFTH